MTPSLPKDLKAFAVLCLLYAPCEAVYLRRASSQYSAMFTRLQGLGPAMGPGYAVIPYAPLAYLSYVPAWYVLCLRDAVQGLATPWTGVWKSMLFATAVYGCYNATNKVTFPTWPVSMLVQDFAWGVTCLTAVGAALVLLMAPS